MKYDCHKTLDFIHEFYRLCSLHPSGCDNDCPLCGDDCYLNSFDEDRIALLQKWSDEHPEKPKLTREEYDFLRAFRVTADKNLGRRVGHMSLAIGYASMELWPTMFSFIKEGETWSLDDLLKLEVKE